MVPLLSWFCRLLTLVLVANNWLPFTTSLLLADSVPAATLTILRSLPTEPTDTVFATSATEPLPSATALLAVADAP